MPLKTNLPNDQKTSNLIRFIHSCFYTLFFITPLLLWPYTSEVFEFNKMIFVYAMTIIIGAAWAYRSIREKQIQIARTPLDLPLTIFLITQTLSTIFSIDTHTSLWGYYSRFHGGLISTICYIFLFYALTTHFSQQTKAIRRLVYAVLSSATITAVYAILEKMGIDKHIWVQDVQNRVFSTLGQPNWLSAYLIAIAPLPIYLATNSQIKTKIYFYLTLTVIYLTAIAFTRSQSGLGATAVTLLSIAITIAIQKKKPHFLVLTFAILGLFMYFRSDYVSKTLISLNKINPFYSDATTIITKENQTRVGGSDSMSIRRVVWQGALELGRRYPILGTGVETFGYTYYWVRPPAHNLTSESDFLYNKAHNEYLNFLANTGYLGLASYLLLIILIIKTFLKHSSVTDINQPLLFGFLSILITNYFGFSVVNIGLFFFLFPAISSAKHSHKVISFNLPISEPLSYTAVSLLAIWLLLGTARTWRADLAYSAGKTNLPESLKAISLNPHEPLYYAQAGYVQSLIATQLIAPQIQTMTASTPAELRQKANSYLEQYTADARKNTALAVSLNPHNLTLLRTKARTELTLAAIDPQYNLEALKSLLKTTELSPTEAHNYYNIGLLYHQLGQADEAKLAFQKAIDLKPDYTAAKDQLTKLP